MENYWYCWLAFETLLLLPMILIVVVIVVVVESLECD